MRGRVALAAGVGVVIVVVVAAVAALGLGLLSSHSRGGTWAVPDPCPITLSKDMLAPGVHAISMLHMAPQDTGWVVGESGLIFERSGGIWTHECSPSQRDLNAVAAVSPHEAWAVGAWGTILHYANGGWSQVPSPTEADLYGVAMPSPYEGWAVGGNDNATLLHYTHGVWSLVTLPIPAYLTGIAMVSPQEGWAVGSEHPSQPKSSDPPQSVLLHYAGGTWTRVASDACPTLTAVAMASRADGWAVGADADGQGCALHYTSGQWVRVAVPDAPAGQPAPINSVSMAGPGDAWAAAGNPWNSAGWLLRYRDNAWASLPASPATILSVAALSPTDVWACSLNMVHHYDGRVWTGTTLAIPPSRV